MGRKTNTRTASSRYRGQVGMSASPPRRWRSHGHQQAVQQRRLWSVVVVVGWPSRQRVCLSHFEWLPLP
jgi:hypothetical protein